MENNKKAILVISFGTSYVEIREKTIRAIEKDITIAYPEYEIRSAFSSEVILRVLAERDKLKIDNVRDAMRRLIADGYTEVFVLPTHVIAGDEYEDMVETVMEFSEKIGKLTIGTPLLFETEDYRKVIEAVMEQFQELSEKEALVLMGHGMRHCINTVYVALDYQFKEMGYKNVFVGTIEAYPGLETVVRKVMAYKPEKVILLPLMVVAGYHAFNEMAGVEEDSWKSVFEKMGCRVECILKGLGEFQSVRNIYLDHISKGIEQ